MCLHLLANGRCRFESVLHFEKELWMVRQYDDVLQTQG